MDRLAMLNEILSQNPDDAFARYGLAMEYSKTGEVERALEEFAKLLSTHPDYTAGYFMAAQTLVTANRVDEAKKMLVDGISSARRTGNAHAQSEMTDHAGGTESFVAPASGRPSMRARCPHDSQREPHRYERSRAIFTIDHSTIPGNSW